MAKVDEALEDEGYVRWVQTGTCLGFVKKGLEDFVLQQSQVLQQRVKNIAGPSVNALCHDAKIIKNKIQGKWTMSCHLSRNCKNCQAYLDELTNVCRPPFGFKHRHFGNSNIHLWPNDIMHWNMAKVYMNPDLDPTQQSQTPQDTDLSNILNFIEHCSVPALAINDQQIVDKVRKCRNSVMHSSTFTVDESDFTNFMTHMVSLLKDQTRLAYIKDAEAGALKITEIKDSQSFTITTDAEFRVLRDRALELQKQNATMMAVVKDLEKECNDLEGNDDEQSKTDLAGLVQEIEEKQASLKELESTFHKLNAFASRKRALKERLNIFTERARTSLNLTKQQLSEIRNKYKRDSTENEPDVLEEAIEQYQTDEERYNALKDIARNLITENKDLKAEMNMLKEKVDSAATEKTKYDHRIGELENKLQEFKSTNEKLNNDIVQKDRKLEDMRVKCDELALENTTNKDTIESMKGDTASIKAFYETRNEELQNAVDEKERDLQKYKADNETLITRINALQQRIDTLRHEADDNKATIDAQETELDVCKANIQSLTQESSDMKATIDKMKTAEKDSQKIIEQLKLAEQEHKDTVLDFKCLTEEIKTLINAKIRQDGIIADLKNANAQISAQLDHVKVENEKKTKELQKASDKNEILRSKIRALASRVKKHSNEVQWLSGINEKLNAEITQLQESIIELRKKLASGEQEKQNLISEKNDLSKKISYLREKIVHLKETSINLDNEVSNLKAEKEKNEADIIMLSNKIRLKEVLIRMFKKDIDAVAELKNDNERLRRTDSTLFRIWSCAVILFVIVCFGWQWVVTFETS